jgi:uncharacterized damage-inducible protein DinB
MLAHHFFTMACNNAWANHRLLGACRALTDTEFAAPRSCFFGSIAATANHNLTVDWFYVDALERAFDGRRPHESPSCFFEPEHPYATCDGLIEAQRAVDLRLRQLTAALTDDRLATVVRIRRSSGLAEDPAIRILAHLFQHQIHHRGQIHAALSSTSVAPPQLDEFFCIGDAPLRRVELAEVGLSEEAVWRSPAA